MLSMRKVFWENPYQHTLKTTVASVNGNEVTFKETIAYSFSGGQHNDKTTVNGLPVVGSVIKKEEPTLIYYTLEAGHGLKVGDPVTMKIDWERRYKLMRLHTAAEIILKIITKAYEYPKVGANIDADGARIDFTTINAFAEEQLNYILNEFNNIIEADIPIKKGYIEEETQRRYWEVEGVGREPCGGTHPETTGEVGPIKLKAEKSGTSKKPSQRIRFTLDDTLFAEARKAQVVSTEESEVAKGFNPYKK